MTCFATAVAYDVGLGTGFQALHYVEFGMRVLACGPQRAEAEQVVVTGNFPDMPIACVRDVSYTTPLVRDALVAALGPMLAESSRVPSSQEIENFLGETRASLPDAFLLVLLGINMNKLTVWITTLAILRDTVPPLSKVVLAALPHCTHLRKELALWHLGQVVNVHKVTQFVLLAQSTELRQHLQLRQP